MKEKTDFRNLILDAAWSMVRQDGWHSLSLRKISGAIEYSVPVIYDHFENKDAILLEFSRQGFMLLGKKLSAASEKHHDPARQLMAIAETYWNFAFRNSAYYQLMFGLGMPCSNVEKCSRERNSFWNLVTGPINQLMAVKGNDRENASMKYHTFWSVLHGLVSIKMLGSAGGPENVDKLVLADAVTGFIRSLEN